MYIDRIKSKQRGNIYHQVLLRKSYRDEHGKVKKVTIANLSQEDQNQVALIDNALKQSKKSGIPTEFDDLAQGREAGTIVVFSKLMEQIRITKTLSQLKFDNQIQTLIFARICRQGSRLQAFDRYKETILPEYQKFSSFGLASLYKSLDELADRKEEIEDALFRHYRKKKQSSANLYLYDVTSSYVEGEYNQSEIVKAGYNRDKKKGKKQIVFGLLTDSNGYALSGQVFAGNTNDTKTFQTQIDTLQKRFGMQSVTLVGDGGMIKTAGIEELQKYGYTYITSIGDAQIKKLLKDDVIQASLFDDTLHETIDQECGVRYITRRNPAMAQEIQETRDGMISYFGDWIKKEVATLNTKKQAKKETLMKKFDAYLDRYRLDGFVSYSIEGDANNYNYTITIDEEKKKEKSLLDGCYCVKTNVPQATKTKEEVHADYKRLITVENAFRTMKTELLEVRPLYLHLDKRIEGHLVVTMLAYNLVWHFENYCRELDQTTENMLYLLSHYMTSYVITGKQKVEIFPQPHPTVSLLFEKVGFKRTTKALRILIQ